MTLGVGTYNYMAPEVVRTKKYDEKVDIYALALIMFYLSSGKRPFYHLFVRGRATHPKSHDLTREDMTATESKPIDSFFSGVPWCFRCFAILRPSAPKRGARGCDQAKDPRSCSSGSHTERIPDRMRGSATAACAASSSEAGRSRRQSGRAPRRREGRKGSPWNTG